MSAADTLARCQRAFDAGDFATVRSLAEPLSRDPDADVAAQARALLERLSIDRTSLGVLACSLLLLLLVARHYVF